MTNRHLLGIKIFILLAFFSFVGQVWAIQALPSNPRPAAKEQDAEEKALTRQEVLDQKAEELRKRIKRFEDSENEDVAGALNVSLEELVGRTESLRDILAYYDQELQEIRKEESLLEEKKILEERIASGEALKLEEAPPYSLEFYDDFSIRLSESERHLETGQLSISVAERALADGKDRLVEAGAKLRQLKGETLTDGDHQRILEHQWRLEQAEREAELVEALVSYQRQALANARLETEIAAIRINLYRRVSERIRQNLHFDPENLEKQLTAIKVRREELEKREAELRKYLRQANRDLDKARKDLEGLEGEKRSDAEADVAAAEQWRETYRVQLEQTENIQQQMGIRKELWKRRYDLVKGVIAREDYGDFKEEAAKQQERFRQRLSLERERQTSLQLQIGKLEEQLQKGGLSWDAKSNLNKQRKALVELVNSTISFVTVLNRTSQMNQHFIDELDRELTSLSFNEIVEISMAKLKSWWQTELFVVDEQALTIGKIFAALVILVLGVILTRILSGLVRKRLLVRMHISPSSAAITGKMIHYAVLLLVALFVMRFVNIPLTAFTFLGGAIAIGVGFGAQKLINNFISSFIIMAEQPIRVSDLIMMGDEVGWIEDIGARCTKVRTYANINILVPNSYFLENNIVNWTHNDNIVRGCITVGVAYGSPTRKVKELLLHAAEEHGEVRKDPAPYVWFADFGDNALLFELYFWVTVTDKTGIKMISSDLRFMIESSFREAGITIAFPQRDLHFDRDRPLRVELARQEGGGGQNS